MGRPIVATAAALLVLTGCTIGNATEPVVADPTAGPTSEASATPSDDPSTAPPPRVRTEDEVREAIDAYVARAQSSQRYRFEQRVQTGTQTEYVATIVTGLVNLDSGRAELAMTMEITDQEYEVELLEAAGLETLVQLDVEVIVASDAEVYLTFPNNANWNDSWLRLDNTAIREVLSEAGLDLDPQAAAGGSDGWLGEILGLLQEPTGYEEQWLELVVSAEMASALLPGSIARAFRDAGVQELTSPVRGYATADEESLWASVWLTPLLQEAAEVAPSLPAPGSDTGMRVVVGIWAIDTHGAVVLPPPDRVVEEPPPLR